MPNTPKNKVNLDWRFSDHQLEFMHSQASEVMLSGAFGSGKSRALCMKGVWLSQYYPGNRGLIVRKHFNTLESSTLWTLLKEKDGLPPVLPPELIINHHKTKHIIEIDTGHPKRPSYIFYAGLDDPAKLGSFAELGWIAIDEGTETEEADWMQLSGRLRHNVPFHQLMTATNPDSPEHYLYKKFYTRDDVPRNDQEYHCIESNSLMNPWLPESYIKRLEKFTGIYKDRYVLGKWVGFAGQIYDIWNPLEHIIPPFKIPGDWPRFRGVDFGWVHPSVCQWWAMAPKEHVYSDPDGTIRCIPEGGMVMYREIYMTKTLQSDLADWIRRETAGENIVATVADWDAEGRETLNNEGIVVSPAMKDVETGIQSAYSRMRLDYTYTRPTPRLLIFNNALCHSPDGILVETKKPFCTADEIPLYRRHHNVKATANPQQLEQPIKKNDHGCDTMRYVSMAVDNIEKFQPMVIKMRIV